MHELCVVIVGGGIAGLSTGIALIKTGHSVHVYEQAPEILPVGAAISVWSNGTKVMNLLGLGKKLKELGGYMSHMAYHDLQDEQMMLAPFEELYKSVGERAVPVSRTKLQQMLMDEFVRLGGHLVLGKVGIMIESEAKSSKKCVVFSDGSKSIYADLIVGADGVKSRIRNFVLNKSDTMDLVTYHYTNWNGIIPIESVQKWVANPSHWTMWVGNGKRASVMPINKKEFYFFFGTSLPQNNPSNYDKTYPHPSPRSEDLRTEMLRLFDDFPNVVKQIILAIDVSTLNRVPVCDVEYDKVDTYSRENVVMIGDAAHGTTPTLGQGGCQAMEDALILADCLSMFDVDIPDCLIRFEEARKRRAEDVTRKARKRTSVIFALNDIQQTETWYNELRQPDAASKVIQGMRHNLANGPYTF